MRYDGKRILVMGAGLSGRAAARFLRAAGAAVVIQDQAALHFDREEAGRLAAEGIEVQLMPDPRPLGRFDLAIISPGIDPRKDWARSVREAGIEIWSELELGWRSCQCPVVAITGTNGKTTTTELVTEMFSRCGLRTLAAGNIGLPLVGLAGRTPEMDVLVLEVSSFQLEQVRSFRPRVAVYLNLTPDHLDRYEGMAEYAAAKARIFEFQKPEDFAVVNAGCTYPPFLAGKISFSTANAVCDLTFADGIIFHRGRPLLEMARTSLRGVHNAENLMAALGVALAWDLPMENAVDALCGYRPKPHRCELVAEIGGVRWINDSKATNTDAVEKALLSQEGRVILIAGGKDKGFSFEPLAGVVGRKVSAALLIGETASKIRRAWEGFAPVEEVGTLGRAVARAAELARPGDVVLLSPACSSFDQFRSYEDRGDQFRNFVLSLGTEHPNKTAVPRTETP